MPRQDRETATGFSTSSTPSNSNNAASSPFHFSFRASANNHNCSARSIRPRRRSRSRSRHRHQHHNHNSMPLNLLGVDRRDVWRTCFCFHVRTVTIFIGVWYLMVYILSLSLMAAVVMYESNNNGMSTASSTISSDQLLPTPVSKIAESDVFAEPRSAEEAPKEKVEGWKNGPLVFFVDSKRATSQYALLTVCNMLITLLMVYGAVRGKPSYLMPFFVLKVFDFCIFCLTMVGYFSYLPNVTEVISETPGLPFREELLRMDPQLLSLLTLIIIVGWISLKAYVIGVIWNCYKYLMLRNTVIRGVISYRHDDPTNILGLQQNLLPDLPDYETAMNDPRYAKKPPLDGVNNGTNNNFSNPPNSSNGPVSTMAIPPPPYSIAISATEHMGTPQATVIDTTVPVTTSSPSPSSNTAIATTNVNITDECQSGAIMASVNVDNSSSTSTNTTCGDSTTVHVRD